MQASIRASNGRYWAVSSSGALTATAQLSAASVFDLSDDASVPILVRERDHGRFLAVAPDGAVTVTHVAPDLAASALVTEPSSLGLETPRGFRALDRNRWLTVSAAHGDAVRADATSRGAAETFALVSPVGYPAVPGLPGSHVVGGVGSNPNGFVLVAGWRECARCGALYDETVADSNRLCFASVAAPAARVLRGPSRQRPHTPKGDAAYRVLATKERTANGVLFLRCGGCAALIDRDDRDRPCFGASGGVHRYAGSLGYSATLAIADPPLRAVARWRVCDACSVLYHDDGSTTVCAAGAQHSPREGASYIIDSAGG